MSHCQAMISLLTVTLLATKLAISVSALPFKPRAVTSLDQTAVDEAQQRDNTATRAFTSVPIKTSSNQCFSVDPLSGDFRENLTPVQLVPCDATSPNQKWDVISSGKHNNVPGFALIVSSLTNACLNFDPRRAPGNQVLLFSCGGRADGGGTVTDSQLFPFSATAGPFVLTPKGSNNQTCLVPNGAVLDQTGCNAASPSPEELFTIGGAVSDVTTTSSPAASTTPPVVTTTPAVTTISVATQTTVAVQSVSRAGGTLNPTAVAESQQRDNTATRAFTSTQIKSAPGQCLSINPNAGDFRENLIPVGLKACNASDPGQKFDVITKGKHNDQPGFALIVSSLTNGCLNFDPRRAAGDQVLLFSCGGRADGGGVVTDSQLFSFGATAGVGPFVLTPKNSNNQICLIPKGAVLDQTACNALSPSPQELFTIGGAAAAVTTTNPPAALTASSLVVTTTPAAITTSVATQTTATVQSVSRAGGRLNPTAVAESQQRDNTATRAFNGAQIKSSAGKCLSIDPNAGDFRENLIPVDLKACNAADPGQKFDVITKGKHNDQPGFALIVSSLTNGCLNFDPRRAAGDQVILFSCGGRADGAGKVTDSQLFSFSSSLTGNSIKLPLAPKNGNGNLCLVDQAGKLGSETCVASNASGADLFTVA